MTFLFCAGFATEALFSGIR